MARSGPLQVAFPLFSNTTSAALSVICAAIGEFVPSNKSPACAAQSETPAHCVRWLQSPQWAAGAPRFCVLLCAIWAVGF
jgi:hypothetical protein